MARTGRHTADQALHHARLDGEVDDRLLLSVVDAGELSLLGLLADNLELLDELGGNVLGGNLRIIQEEGLALDGDLAHGLAVHRDRTVVGDLDARHLLEQVHQVVIVRGEERGGVILDRVFLDDDRVADGGDFRGIELFLVDLHLDLTQVDGFRFHLDRSFIGLIAQQFSPDRVSGVAHGFERERTLVIGKGILGRFGLPVPGQGYGGKAQSLPRRIIDQDTFDVVLGKQTETQEHSC